MTNKEKLAHASKELGLTCTGHGSDGWETSWKRADGLHLWALGSGAIQTAVITDGLYTDHLVFNWMPSLDGVDNLIVASCRVLPKKRT